MAANVLLLLLLLLCCQLPAQSLGQHFRGGTVTFEPVGRYRDGSVLLSLHHKEAFQGQCGNWRTWSCNSGDCGQVVSSQVAVTDQDASSQILWCHLEDRVLRNLTSDRQFSLTASDCCWDTNVNGVSNITLLTKVDMGVRSDTHAVNKPPVLTTVPTIRIPQNCPSTLQFLSYDPDGDQVVCQHTDLATCEWCQTPNFTLAEEQCILQMNGTPNLGVHVFMMNVEDFPRGRVALSYADGTSSVRNPLNLSQSEGTESLSSLPLHFSVEVQPPLTTCTPGVVKPQFLSPTPSHGDVLYASVGNPFQVTVRAKATESRIFDFQISGPQNMTKSFRYYSSGVAQVLVNWTAQDADVYRNVPMCFTAETAESQSEMRCIVVVVIKFALQSGEAEVVCSENTMTITLEKASMLGVDDRHLQLKDPTCSLTSNETHIMGSVSLNSCGTELEDTGDYIVFKNEIDSENVANSVITRQQFVKIPFSCSYPKRSSVMSSFRNHKSDYVFTESSFGSFSFSFEFYNDSTFNTVIDPSGYPVEVNLMDMINIGIVAHAALLEVQLFVMSCRATPDDNPENPLYYDIIKNGCIMDETVIIHPSNLTEFKLEMQAFKFSGEFEQVYINCQVVLCEAGNQNSRCSQGCVENAERRRRRGVTLETKAHYISQGPLQLVKPASRGSAALPGDGSGSPSAKKSTMVFGGLFVVTLLLLVGVMFYNSVKTKRIERNALLSSF